MSVTVLEEYREERATRRYPLVDAELEHQLRLVTSRAGGGAGITATCNCNARLPRNLEVGENAITVYRQHLAGAW